MAAGGIDEALHLRLTRGQQHVEKASDIAAMRAERIELPDVEAIVEQRFAGDTSLLASALLREHKDAWVRDFMSARRPDSLKFLLPLNLRLLAAGPGRVGQQPGRARQRGHRDRRPGHWAG